MEKRPRTDQENKEDAADTAATSDDEKDKVEESLFLNIFTALPTSVLAVAAAVVLGLAALRWNKRRGV